MRIPIQEFLPGLRRLATKAVEEEAPQLTRWAEQDALAKALRGLDETPVQGWLPDMMPETSWGPETYSLGHLWGDDNLEDFIPRVVDARQRGFGGLEVSTPHHSYEDAQLLAVAGGPGQRRPSSALQHYLNQDRLFALLNRFDQFHGTGRG